MAVYSIVVCVLFLLIVRASMVRSNLTKERMCRIKYLDLQNDTPLLIVNEMRELCAKFDLLIFYP